jgi:hypothetical protein
LFAACSSVEEGGWVQQKSDSAGQTSDVFYVLEKISPYGENEKREDPEGHERRCLLLKFTEQSTADSDGNKLYAAQPIEEAGWDLCRDYSTTDEPRLALDSIPDELSEELSPK